MGWKGRRPRRTRYGHAGDRSLNRMLLTGYPSTRLPTLVSVAHMLSGGKASILGRRLVDAT